MRNIMYFKGVSSAQLGVVVTKLPGIPVPEPRGDWEKVSGRHGEVFITDGCFDCVSMPVQLWIPPEANVAAVTHWLTGSGQLRFSSWNWFWEARVSSAAVLTPCTMNDGWNAAVTIKAQPHRYRYPQADPVTLTSAGNLTNPGTAEAEPLIVIAGTGDINLMVAGTSLLVDDLDGTITIDCAARLAYDGDVLMTNRISAPAKWPTLPPGLCAISWSGGATSVIITPRWRDI